MPQMNNLEDSSRRREREIAQSQSNGPEYSVLYTLIRRCHESVEKTQLAHHDSPTADIIAVRHRFQTVTPTLLHGTDVSLRFPKVAERTFESRQIEG